MSNQALPIHRTFRRTAAVELSAWARIFAAACMALLATNGVSTAEAAGSQDSPEQTRQVRLTGEQCEKLIGQLASRNSPPTLKRDRTDDPNYPENFEKMDEDRVKTAYATLVERVAELLPHLVKHADDDRYSYTAQSPSGYWSNNTVEVCELRHYSGKFCDLYSYCPSIDALIKDGISDESEGHRTLVGGSKRKGGFWQLQLHWLEWALEEERKTPFDSAAEEAAVIDGLQRAIAKLKETEAPIKVGKRLVLRPK